MTRRGVRDLQAVFNLCAASPWLTELLSRHPLLLDDLIDARQAELPDLPIAMLRRRPQHRISYRQITV